MNKHTINSVVLEIHGNYLGTHYDECFFFKLCHNRALLHPGGWLGFILKNRKIYNP